MPLHHIGYIELPPHAKPGGFDHAAVHRRTRRVYVAHTANDAVDVIDGSTHRHVGSIPNLRGVAGALVSDEHDLVFTSNRAENTVGICSVMGETVTKVGVGVRPNGLAYDPSRHRLLAANVGDPTIASSFTVSIVDVETSTRVADIPVAGRTRWTVFDATADVFYVNIADPPQIVVIEAGHAGHVARTFTIPAAGPHGLDLDTATRRLYCACDGKTLVALDCRSGDVLAQAGLAGVPDVIFFNRERQHLYVAIGDPGLIEVFETERMRCLETVRTEPGAHTIGFDPIGDTVYAFLPETHRAAVYVDQG